MTPKLSPRSALSRASWVVFVVVSSVTFGPPQQRQRLGVVRQGRAQVWRSDGDDVRELRRVFVGQQRVGYRARDETAHAEGDQRHLRRAELPPGDGVDGELRDGIRDLVDPAEQ